MPRLHDMKDPHGLEPLFPDRESDEPLGRQFVRRLRFAIETGLFKPSSRLLPSRELAARLGLSRNTVTSAIDQLIAEGYLESRVGSGTYVVAEIVKRTSVRGSVPERLPDSAERVLSLRPLLRRYASASGALRSGVPDLAEFPYATWARITRRKLAELRNYLDYGETSGHRALREAIVQHVQQFRGITAEPHRVIVVEGTQAATRLAADVLLGAGDAVLIEDPCYPLVRAAFAARSARLLPVRVDDDGLDVARAPAANLAYVSPSHQYPLTSALSVERRHLLLEWARENDAYVVEDDYDSEYAFDGKPLPAMQSLDRYGRVIYVGSFSKTLAPALRLGYLIVPQHVAEAFSVARLIATFGGTRYVQATLADFVAEGHFARHVRRMTRIYAERREALLGVLREGLPGDRFVVRSGSMGLHLTIVGPADFDDAAVAERLSSAGIVVEPLSAYCVERTDCRGFALGYSSAPSDAIVRDARTLVREIVRAS